MSTQGTPLSSQLITAERLLAEALEENLRLRGIVLEVLEKLNDDLCAENERLRAALAKQIDYEQLIADCFETTRQRQGSLGCRQFARGAEWWREQVAKVDGAAPARRADGMPASADERKLRRMYAFRVGMPGTYMDDGEAQGEEHGIRIDFMREPVAEIAQKALALQIARHKAAEHANVPPRKQQPLTETQIQELCCAVDAGGARPAATALIRAVEQAHGIGA